MRRWVNGVQTNAPSPSGAASGDLGGTYPAPTVAGLQGEPVASDAPAPGDVLTFDGTEWAPAAPVTPETDGPTVYDFSSDTGITLAAGSVVGSTADVSGGALVCTVTDRADFSADLSQLPKGSVPLVSSGGRALRRWRASVRLVGLTEADGHATSYAATRAYLAALGDSGEWACWRIAANGQGFRDTSAGGGGVVAGTYLLDGTQWIELEYSDGVMLWRHGTGVGTAEPTSWTTLTPVAMAGVQWATVSLAAAFEDFTVQTARATWDDLTVEDLG